MVEIKRMTRESQDWQVSASVVNCPGRSRFSASLCQTNWQKLVSANFFYQNTQLFGHNAAGLLELHRIIPANSLPRLGPAAASMRMLRP